MLGCSQKNYPISDHFNGSSFQNPAPFEEKKFSDFLSWMWDREQPKNPASIDNQTFTEKPRARLAPGEVSYTFIGHATVLIQIGPLNFLTDPVFSERASPVSFAGPKRFRKPGLELSELPPIDVVLLSHNHYDHMDKTSIQYLAEKHSPLFLTGLGNKELLQTWGAQQVKEMDWEQSHVFASGLSIHFVRAQHFSARGLFDRNKTLWGGFVVDAPEGQVYFAGDTGYADFFKEFAVRFPRIILSLIPIGAYEPRWFMKPVHTNPAEALQLHRDLKSEYSLGIHWGTFTLTDELWDQPQKDLADALRSKPLTDGSQFQISPEGKVIWLKQLGESERTGHKAE